MQSVWLTSAYLAPIHYYTKLYLYDKAYIECFDHYMKQTYRNRCYIAGPEGIQSLTIPTEKCADPKCLMKDVRISDHGHWRHVHWNALQTAYHNSPFFDYYADDFAPFYEKRYTFLWDFNQELCRLVCCLLDIQPELIPTSQYEACTGNDFREQIHPKRPFASDTSFVPARYYQVFQPSGFIPNLSIVDLLFNMGPESIIILRDSIQAS